MKRIAVLCALAAALGGAPAAAATPHGEIVIVASGNTTGTITLPAAVTARIHRATYQTTSPYVVFAFIRDGRIEGGDDWYQGGDPLPYPVLAGVPAGRTTVRVLTAGPVTVRVPVTGIRGRYVVRPRTPLRGAVARLVDVPVLGPTARSELPVTVPPNSLTVHGYLNSGGDTPYREQLLCLSAEACEEKGQTGTPPVEVFVYWPTLGIEGDLTARLVVADPGRIGRLRHLLLVLPVG